VPKRGSCRQHIDVVEATLLRIPGQRVKDVSQVGVTGAAVQQIADVAGPNGPVDLLKKDIGLYDVERGDRPRIRVVR
jgi:hypothetical protein